MTCRESTAQRTSRRQPLAEPVRSLSDQQHRLHRGHRSPEDGGQNSRRGPPAREQPQRGEGDREHRQHSEGRRGRPVVQRGEDEDRGDKGDGDRVRAPADDRADPEQKRRGADQQGRGDQWPRRQVPPDVTDRELVGHPVEAGPDEHQPGEPGDRRDCGSGDGETEPMGSRGPGRREERGEQGAGRRRRRFARLDACGHETPRKADRDLPAGERRHRRTAYGEAGRGRGNRQHRAEHDQERRHSKVPEPPGVIGARDVQTHEPQRDEPQRLRGAPQAPPGDDGGDRGGDGGETDQRRRTATHAHHRPGDGEEDQRRDEQAQGTQAQQELRDRCAAQGRRAGSPHCDGPSRTRRRDVRADPCRDGCATHRGDGSGWLRDR